MAYSSDLSIQVAFSKYYTRLEGGYISCGQPEVEMRDVVSAGGRASEPPSPASRRTVFQHVEPEPRVISAVCEW